MNNQLEQIKVKQKEDCKMCIVFGILNLLIGLRRIDVFNIFSIIGISFFISPLVVFIFWLELNKWKKFFSSPLYIGCFYLIVTSFRREGLLMGGFGAFCITAIFGFITTFSKDLMIENELLVTERRETQECISKKDFEIESLKVSLEEAKHDSEKKFMRLKEGIADELHTIELKRKELMEAVEEFNATKKEWENQINERMIKNIRESIELENKKQEIKEDIDALKQAESKQKKSTYEQYLEYISYGLSFLSTLYNFTHFH